jgi:hypothetical protein
MQGTRVNLDHNEYHTAPRYRPSLGRFVCGQTRQETLRRYELISGAIRVRDVGESEAAQNGGRADEVPPSGARANGRTFYQDSENAHDAVLQRSALASIEVILSLFREGAPMGQISLLSIDECVSRLGEQGQDVREWLRADGRHPIYGVSFPELLRHVVTAADSHQHRAEFLRRVREEMAESRGLCLGGRMARLVNACVGYVPGVALHVPETESLTTKVLFIMKTNRKVTPDQRSFNALCSLHVAELLDEHGVTNVIERDAYLDPFRQEAGQ